MGQILLVSSPGFPSPIPKLQNALGAQDMPCRELSLLGVASHLNITTTQEAGIALVPPTLQMKKPRPSEVKLLKFLQHGNDRSRYQIQAWLTLKPGMPVTLTVAQSRQALQDGPPRRATSLGTLPYSPFPS